MASVTFDLVTHEDARRASPAIHLAGGVTLTYGELAESVGEYERALRHDGKALVLCAGDRDLPTLLAYLAALRLGHTVAFLPASARFSRHTNPNSSCRRPTRLPNWPISAIVRSRNRSPVQLSSNEK